MATTTQDRTTLLKGPAKMVWDGATILFAEDLSVDLITEHFDVNSSAHGRIGRRVKDRRIEIKGAPLMFSDLGKLFPYATHQYMDALFGATDKPAVITPRNGAPLTIANVMPTALAGITCHPSKAMLREMTFTGICANGSDPSVMANFFAWGSAASNVALTGLVLASIPNAFYSASFNAATYKPVDGFDIDFLLNTEPDYDNGLTVGYRLVEHEASVKFMPGPHTEAAYATLMGWSGKQPGDDAANYSLAISADAAGKPVITLANMMVESGGVKYGRAPRNGEITMQSVRQINAGLATALYAFTTVGA